MAHIVADRIKTTTTTTGTGPFALLAAVTGFRAFSAVMVNGDTAFYTAKLGAAWEVGKGTFNSDNTLARTSVLTSSNANALVDFAAGSKEIFLTDPAILLGALTGHVTKPADTAVTTIAANTVTNAMLADMAAATVKMRAAGAGTGAPIDGTASQAKTALGFLSAASNLSDVADAATARNTLGAYTFVASIAALRLLTTTTNPDSVVRVLSWHSGLDKGGGTFRYDSTDAVSADNSGTVIVDASGRRWKREMKGPPALSMFGCKLDATTDDATAAQAAFDATEVAGGTLIVDGHCLSTLALTYAAAFPTIIRGYGSDSSSFIFDHASAGLNGLVITMSVWHTSGVPEVHDIGIRTKYAGAAGRALGISYTTYTSGATFKGPVVKNCNIQAATSPGAATAYWTDAILISNAPHSHISGCFIGAIGGGVGTEKFGKAIQVSNNSTAPNISGNDIYNHKYAIYVDGVQSEGLIGVGNRIISCENGLVYRTGASIPGCYFANNEIDCQLVNIDLQYLSKGLFVGNKSYWSGGNTPHTDVLVGTGCDLLTFSANQLSKMLESNSITGISQANPAVVTYSGADNWANGDTVFISGVVGMTQVNKLSFTVAGVNTGANTFQLSGIDSSAYGAYSSGGTVEGYSIGFNINEAGTFHVVNSLIRSRSKGIVLGSAATRVTVAHNDTDALPVEIENSITSGNLPLAVVTGRRAASGNYTTQQFTAIQSLTDAVATVLTNWGTTGADIVDRGGGTAAAGKVTTLAGTYRVKVKAMVQFTSNAVGYRRVQILKNGSVYLGGADVVIAAANGLATIVHTETAPTDIVGGTDYFEVQATQTSGGALNVQASTQCTLTMTVLA